MRVPARRDLRVAREHAEPYDALLERAGRARRIDLRVAAGDAIARRRRHFAFPGIAGIGGAPAARQARRRARERIPGLRERVRAPRVTTPGRPSGGKYTDVFLGIARDAAGPAEPGPVLVLPVDGAECGVPHRRGVPIAESPVADGPHRHHGVRESEQRLLGLRRRFVDGNVVDHAGAGEYGKEGEGGLHTPVVRARARCDRVSSLRCRRAGPNRVTRARTARSWRRSTSRRRARTGSCRASCRPTS